MQPNWIEKRAYLTPNRVALRFGDEQWTWKEMHDIAVTVAGQLTHYVKRKERVAILAPSTPQLIQLIFSCMHLQLEIVFLNGRLTTEELTYQIEDAQVNTVFVVENELHKLAPQIQHVILEDVLATEQREVAIVKEWPDDYTVSIMYTSGTTGFPKGVRQTIENHASSALSSALNLGLGAQDRWLCTVPIFHISGFSIVMRSLLYGISIHLYEKFDVKKITTELINGTVTHISVVSLMLARIIRELEEQEAVAHANVKTVLAGGGSIAPDYLRRAEKRQLPVVQTYGMTETSSQTATLAAEDALQKVGSAGKALFFNDIKIDGASKPYEEGEIVIRGPHVTPGYIGRFANKCATVNGWLHTGDIGYLDEEGYLYVVDRRADLIISGGENIYPAEIENVLLAYPSIVEAGVCAVADDMWGHVPAAFIVLKEACPVENIAQFCETKLARYKIPKYFYFVDELPRNASNKLLRRKLHELLPSK